MLPELRLRMNLFAAISCHRLDWLLLMPRATAVIRREMRRRAAIEPVIGDLKGDHRMHRNYLAGFEGDRANAILATAGYNFRLLLRWLALLLRALVRLALLFTPGADRTLAAPNHA